MMSMMMLLATVDLPLLMAGAFGVASILGGALALGIRHGVDWDHIAAITDITSSTTSSADGDGTRWLQHEPGLLLSDESHHSLERVSTVAALTPAMALAGSAAHVTAHDDGLHHHHAAKMTPFERVLHPHRPALLLGTMYALGHGTMVAALGLLALLASEFLPAWIDPVMERIVGVTLIFLAAYLFYSLYRYLRGGEEFHLRSRWMIVFAAARRLFHFIGDKLSRESHVHEHPPAFSQQYGAATAYGVGLIHGVGAETGTQVLIIATAVGAGSKIAGVGALVAFVVGLLISNSIVTLMSTVGFFSSRGKQRIYVAVGVIAAVFSLFVGVVFLLQAGGSLPDLGRYFRWVGGPD
jgi:high-affinity nickel-transport protein